MANEIWIYAVAFLDLLANSLVIPSMAPYLRFIGGSTFTIGAVISTNLVLQLISAPFAVNWSKSKDQYTTLQISLLVGCISFLVMGSATSVSIVLLCRSVEGVLHHTQAICAGLLEKIGPHEGHAKMQRWWNSFKAYSVILGGVIVGHIMEIRGGYYYVCIIIAMIFLLNASIAYIFIPTVASNEMKNQEKKNKNKTTEKTGKSGSSAGHEKKQYSLFTIFKPIIDLFDIPQSKNILDVLILTFLTEFALMAHIQNFAPVLWDVYKTPSRWIGYTLGLQGLFIVLALSWIDNISRLYSSDQNCAQRIFHGFGIFMLSSGCLYFAPSWNGVIIFIIPMSISYALLKSATSELLRLRSASGTATVGLKMSTLARIIAPLCTGLAYDFYGYLGTSMLKVAGAGIGAMISLSLFKHKTVVRKQKKKQ